MRAVEVTEKEVKAMLACLNYEDRENQLCDNFSNAGSAEIAQVLGNSLQAAGGVMSSLIQKGLASYDDNNGDDILWLTDDGVNRIFDILDARPGLKEKAFG